MISTPDDVADILNDFEKNRNCEFSPIVDAADEISGMMNDPSITKEDLLDEFEILDPQYKHLLIVSDQANTSVTIDTNSFAACDIVLPYGSVDFNNGNNYFFGTVYANEVDLSSRTSFFLPNDDDTGSEFFDSSVTLDMELLYYTD